MPDLITDTPIEPIVPPLTPEEWAQQQRQFRDGLLTTTVDSFNPMRWASLTPAQQQEVEAYRQALLDVTKQPGWPYEVEWPVKPSWI